MGAQAVSATRSFIHSFAHPLIGRLLPADRTLRQAAVSSPLPDLRTLPFSCARSLGCLLPSELVSRFVGSYRNDDDSQTSCSVNVTVSQWQKTSKVASGRLIDRSRVKNKTFCMCALVSEFRHHAATQLAFSLQLDVDYYCWAAATCHYLTPVSISC